MRLQCEGLVYSVYQWRLHKDKIRGLLIVNFFYKNPNGLSAMQQMISNIWICGEIENSVKCEIPKIMLLLLKSYNNYLNISVIKHIKLYFIEVIFKIYI